MNGTRTKPRAVPPMLLVLLGVGCSIDTQEAKDGCDALADCPFGSVCDLGIRQCVPEPYNGFMGQFGCVLIGQDDPVPGLGDSQIVGRPDDIATALPLVTCRLTESTVPKVRITAEETVGFNALRVYLRASDVAGGRAVDLIPQRDIDLSNTASYGDWDRDQVTHRSAGGYVFFDQTPAVGQWMSGYLDIAMAPAADADALYGVPCVGGVAECGRSNNTLCSAFAEYPVCFWLCESQADCDADSQSACIAGYCLRGCAAGEACIAPLECYELSESGDLVCL